MSNYVTFESKCSFNASMGAWLRVGVALLVTLSSSGCNNETANEKPQAPVSGVVESMSAKERQPDIAKKRTEPKLTGSFTVPNPIFLNSILFFSQEENRSLAEIVNKEILRIGWEQGDTQKLAVLDQPILIPSESKIPELSKSALSPVFSVPKFREDGLVSLGSEETRFSEIVKGFISAKLSTGEVELTNEQKEEFEASLSVLFKDPEDRTERTEEYEAFSAWQEKRLVMAEEMQDDNLSDEKRLIIARKLRRLDSNYKATYFDSEREIRAAKASVAEVLALQPQLDSLLPNAIEALSSENSELLNSQAYKAILKSAGWSRIAIEGEALAEKKFEFSLGSLRRKFAVQRFEFEYKMNDVSPSVLDSDLFKNRQWKRQDGEMLSSGTGEKADIAPFFVEKVVFVRNMKVSFLNDQDLEQIEKALRSQADFAVGELPMNAKQGAFLLPDQLNFPRPLVLSVVVTKTPKIPNPLENLKWSE